MGEGVGVEGELYSWRRFPSMSPPLTDVPSIGLQVVGAQLTDERPKPSWEGR